MQCFFLELLLMPFFMELSIIKFLLRRFYFCLLIYIASNLKDRVKRNDIFISALPYAGSAYLLKKFLIDDKLLSKAVVLYLKEKKLQAKDYFLNLIIKRNK